MDMKFIDMDMKLINKRNTMERPPMWKLEGERKEEFYNATVCATSKHYRLCLCA